jgi:hypothetical protein
MPLRVTFHESDDADSLVDTLLTAGFAAGASRERFAGEDDGEAIVYVVHTDAPTGDVEELVADLDAWVEEVDPLTSSAGAVADPAADIQPPDLPDVPRRNG